MRFFYIVISSAFWLTSTALAAKFALVLGGAAQGSEVHDFARITASVTFGLRSRSDYQTTFLLGDVAGSEEKHFKDDFNYIEGNIKPNGAATDKNLDDALGNIVAQAKKNDQVEIFIAAHGGCDEPGPDCAQSFSIYEKDGKLYDYPSDKLAEYLKKLDANGVKTTLILESCFSGALDSKVKGLKNTCTFLLSSPYTYGAGCSTNEPLENKYYTSTVEAVALRYYKNVLPQLAAGFYRDNSCFKYMTKHVSENMQVDHLGTVYDAYWQGLVKDSNNHRPILSSTGDSVFSLINKLDRQNFLAPICTDGPKLVIENLSEDIFGIARKKYAAAVNEYDLLMKEQNKIISDSEHETVQSRLIKFQRLQEIYPALTSASQNVLKIEREILSEAEKTQAVNDNDPCKRPL